MNATSKINSCISFLILLLIVLMPLHASAACLPLPVCSCPPPPSSSVHLQPTIEEDSHDQPVIAIFIANAHQPEQWTLLRHLDPNIIEDGIAIPLGDDLFLSINPGIMETLALNDSLEKSNPETEPSDVFSVKRSDNENDLSLLMSCSTNHGKSCMSEVRDDDDRWLTGGPGLATIMSFNITDHKGKDLQSYSSGTLMVKMVFQSQYALNQVSIVKIDTHQSGPNDYLVTNESLRAPNTQESLSQDSRDAGGANVIPNIKANAFISIAQVNPRSDN